MEKLVPVLMGAIAAITGFVRFINAFSVMHRLRLIRDIPQSQIRSLAMGLVEIHGRVRAKETLTTPVSRVECVQYRYEFQKYVQSKNGGHWKTIAEGRRGEPFYTVDESGEVLVDPNGARFNYDVRRQYKVTTGFLEGTGRVREFLDAWDRGVESGGRSADWEVEEQEIGGWFLFGTGDKRIREYYIVQDDVLYVMGTAVGAPDEPRQVKIAGTDNEEVPFLISNRSERELASKLKQKMFLDYVIGGIMLAIGLGFLLYKANLI